MRAHLSRRYPFSASHRLYSESYSEEENREVYGKCNNPHGHGHNYVVEVTVAGEVDERTGFVIDLKRLKDLVNREVIDPLDHRHLNKEIPEFRDQIPTTENLAIAIWK